MKKTLLLIFCLSVGAGMIGFSAWTQPEKTATTQTVQDADSTEPQTISVHGIIPTKYKTDLVGESEVIVRGKVKELLPSRWSNPNWGRGQDVRNVIQTDVMVHVNKVFKGTPYDKDIAIRIDKGYVGNTTWKSEDNPDFAPDEDVILFLHTDNSDVARPDEKYYVLTGMVQGKFTLDAQHPEDKRFRNDKDFIDPSTFVEEIPAEEEAYKKKPKPAKANPNI
ncbi:hypothetical protein JJB07_01160 [Tumebacillus sp. ITR2]|uniref:Secreted protein n=1 Tax=Tumebacillus amylolyticus TaxID=2801339 RepID=A0ABS1J4N8_9BACL|nr:hypothetical protein [Tumebacillus amylolyticus]MBL0385240.1 hypothetical protein [Tumebacillus amylolyticus]